MIHKKSAVKMLISLLVGACSCGYFSTAFAMPPSHGSMPPPPGSFSRPNPGSTVRNPAPGINRPNPGSTLRNPPGPPSGSGNYQRPPGPGGPNGQGRYWGPGGPQGPAEIRMAPVRQLPIPQARAINPRGPGSVPGNAPRLSPGYSRGPQGGPPNGFHPGYGPQRPPYLGPSPYPHWRRSGIVFHFGWPRAYYWWGCRRGVTFGEYLLLALMVEALRTSQPRNIDDLYSEHLNGVSYEAMCEKYGVDWTNIQTSARFRYNQMGAYARGEGIAFWTWDDRLIY